MSEVFDAFVEANNLFSNEGERGVRNLETVVTRLGYGKGMMRNREIEDFLSDNPGAIEVLMDFIREWTPRNAEWTAALTVDPAEADLRDYER